MTISFQDHVIPAVSTTPVYRGGNIADFNYSARLFWDSAFQDVSGKLTTNKIVIYFHGSGASGIPATTDAMVRALAEDGWFVIYARHFNVFKSSSPPWVYGYGNVNNPNIFGYTVRLSRWVQAILEWVYVHSALHLVYEPNDIPKCLLLGQSMGATSILAWSAFSQCEGLAETDLSDRVQGFVANAATMAGLGNYVWNDPMTIINAFSDLYSQVKHSGIMYYNDQDTYAPPAFSKRYQMTLNPDANVKFKSVGRTYGHNWYSDNITELLASMNAVQSQDF